MYSRAVKRITGFWRITRNQHYVFYGFLILIVSLLLALLLINHAHANYQHYLDEQRLTERQKTLQSLTERLEQATKLKVDTEAQLKQKQATEAQLQSQIKQLNDQLQSKKEQQSLIAQVGNAISPKVYAEPVQSNDYYVNWIIQHESGGNPNAVNPSSGACGLFQRLPCNVPLGNVAAQMADGLAYINNRYGSAYNAYLYWQAHGNY